MQALLKRLATRGVLAEPEPDPFAQPGTRASSRPGDRQSYPTGPPADQTIRPSYAVRWHAERHSHN
ncbi:hypothetical protein GCM10010446_60820 [Streptomyces enissocaesilis]|uniref:Uncharacterized protein n=1 Tax=Streptomyces enissocaesilis TaxID=332589 RepID=A0ABP6K6Q5_9ACTN